MPAFGRPIGLDIETTGSTFPKHELIQIGAYDGPKTRPLLPNIDGSRFTSDVGHTEYVWEQEALNVNHFTHDRIKAGPKPEVVDQQFHDWLWSRGFRNKSHLRAIPVGFNVGQFDMPFVRKAFPIASKLISWHTIDLNAVMMFCCDTTGNDFEVVKKESKKVAQGRIAGQVAWHDAGYDAEAALRIYEWLTGKLKGALGLPTTEVPEVPP